MILNKNIEFLKSYLEVSEKQISKKCTFYEAKNLPEFLYTQYDFFDSTFISDFVLVVVYDELMHFKQRGWHQACPEHKMVMLKKSKFDEDKDSMATLVHDLAHIEQFAMIGAQKFNELRGQKQFKELEGGTYPNNKTEYYAFSKQFKYLASQNVTIENIRNTFCFLYDYKIDYMSFIDIMIKENFNTNEK